MKLAVIPQNEREWNNLRRIQRQDGSVYRFTTPEGQLLDIVSDVRASPFPILIMPTGPRPEVAEPARREPEEYDPSVPLWGQLVIRRVAGRR
jgi:hypothetical protein